MRMNGDEIVMTQEEFKGGINKIEEGIPYILVDIDEWPLREWRKIRIE